MATTATAAPPQRSSRKAGRGYLGIGLLIGVLAPLMYIAQLQAKRLTVPWYMPMLGTIAVCLVILSLARARTLWRFLALGLLGFLAFVEWAMPVMSRLPEYKGPVAVGKPFPAFKTTLHDGSTFTQADLTGDRSTVMVFFRGRW